MSKIFPIILCGGSGHRLWPLSSTDTPKQFLKLFNDKTLLENTIDRLYNNDICYKPVLLTNCKYFNFINNLVKSYNISKIILEPDSKNTAPAIIGAIISLYHTNPDDFVIIMPSDAYIKNIELFNNYVNEAFKYCQNNKIISFGIVPTGPNVNYGYIEKFNSDFDGNFIYSVKQFKEKPDFETAKKFLTTKNFLWNSGIFIGKISLIYKLFEIYNQQLFKNIFNSVKEGISINNVLYLNKYFYSFCENVSIDYSFMEKLNKNELSVMQLDIEWKDLGSYDMLETIIKKDAHNNAKVGNVLLEDSYNNFIYSTKAKICCSNIKNLLIVENNGTFFITTKDKIVDLKDILNNFEIKVKENNFK